MPRLLRFVSNFRLLRERATPDAHIVVIGGGFIGSEVTAAVTGAGCRVTMLVPEQGIGARLFPEDLSAFVTDQYRERGVNVLAGESVDVVEHDGDRFTVRLGSGRLLAADAVVAGIGIEPRVELAQAAGAETDNGVVVDAYGRVAGVADVYAAGDVASFPAAALGRRMRVEHEDHARAHGAAVGANMAG